MDFAKFHAPKKLYTFKIRQQNQVTSKNAEGHGQTGGQGQTRSPGSLESSCVLPSWQQRWDSSSASSGTPSQVSSECSSIDSSPQSLISPLCSAQKPENHISDRRRNTFSDITVALDDDYLEEDYLKYPQLGQDMGKVSINRMKQEGLRSLRGSGNKTIDRDVLSSKWTEPPCQKHLGDQHLEMAKTYEHGLHGSKYQDEGTEIERERISTGVDLDLEVRAGQDTGTLVYNKANHRKTDSAHKVDNSFQIYSSRQRGIDHAEGTPRQGNLSGNPSASSTCPEGLVRKGSVSDSGKSCDTLVTSSYQLTNYGFANSESARLAVAGGFRDNNDLLYASSGGEYRGSMMVKAAVLNQGPSVSCTLTSSKQSAPSCLTPEPATSIAFNQGAALRDPATDSPPLPSDYNTKTVSSNQCSALQNIELDCRQGRASKGSDEPDSAITNTLKSEDHQTCQVCCDIAAGFHCGAYVCEACKKFFVRCLKQDVGEKFVCSHGKHCMINKETRTQCQYCRYHKCLSLGMYKPGSGPGGGKMSAEISHIPCKVCNAPSSGYHFGAITCEGCKGFFRRTVKERDGVCYTCSRNGICAITTVTRNICKYCRYQKCLQVGMTRHGSRIGRQPNAVKHATMLELQRIQTVGSSQDQSEVKVKVKKERLSPGLKDDACMLPENAHLEPIDIDEIVLIEGTQMSQSVFPSNQSDGNVQIVSDSRNEDRETDTQRRNVRLVSDRKPERSSRESCAAKLTDREIIAGEEKFTQALTLDRPRHQAASSPCRGKQQVDAQIQHIHDESFDDQQVLGLYPSGFGLELGDPSRHYGKHEEPADPHRCHAEGFTVDRGHFGEQPFLCASNPLAHQQELPQPTHPNFLLPLHHLPEDIRAPFRQEHQQHPLIDAQHPLIDAQHPLIDSHHPLIDSQQSLIDTQGHGRDFIQPQPGVGGHCQSKEVHGLVEPDDLQDPRMPQQQPLQDTVKYDIDQGFQYKEEVSEVSARGQPGGTDQLLPPIDLSVYPANTLREKSHSTSTPLSSDVASGIPSPGPTILGSPTKNPQIPSPTVEQDVLKRLEEMTQKLTKAYKFLQPILKRNPDIKTVEENSSIVEVWGIMMGQFAQCAHSTIKFARQVPGFRLLPIETQIMQVQMSMYPIVLILLSTMYNAEKKIINYFNLKPEETEIVFEKFPTFRVLPNHFHTIGHSTKYFDLDDTELALLCALTLVDNLTLTPDEECGENLITDLVNALMHYCAGQRGSDTNRGGYILARLPELVRCNLQHQQAVIKVKMDHPELEIPQLYRETYLNS